MTLLKQLLGELIGMFIGDAPLALALLALVALAGAALEWSRLDPLVGGAILVVGPPLLLLGNVRRHKMLSMRRKLDAAARR